MFMKKTGLILMMMLPFILINAQQFTGIKLNVPDKNRGASVMQALSLRQSAREYSDKLLSVADMSDLFWAADGINREDGRRTAPSAMNAQDVALYALLRKGFIFMTPRHSN